MARGARYALCGLGGPGQVLLRGMIGRGRLRFLKMNKPQRTGGTPGLLRVRLGGPMMGRDYPSLLLK